MALPSRRLERLLAATLFALIVTHHHAHCTPPSEPGAATAAAEHAGSASEAGIDADAQEWRSHHHELENVVVRKHRLPALLGPALTHNFTLPEVQLRKGLAYIGALPPLCCAFCSIHLPFAGLRDERSCLCQSQQRRYQCACRAAVAQQQWLQRHLSVHKYPLPPAAVVCGVPVHYAVTSCSSPSPASRRLELPPAACDPRPVDRAPAHQGRAGRRQHRMGPGGRLRQRFLQALYKVADSSVSESQRHNQKWRHSWHAICIHGEPSYAPARSVKNAKFS